MNNEHELHQSVATCFNAIHAHLGYQITADDIYDILKLTDLIEERMRRLPNENQGIPSVILEASKGR